LSNFSYDYLRQCVRTYTYYPDISGKKLPEPVYHLLANRIYRKEDRDRFEQLAIKNKWNVNHLAREIRKERLSKKENQYNSISIINNYQKTFFTQKQALSIIVPLENTKKETDTIQPKQIEEYTWLEEPHDILNRLIWTYLEVIIEYHLFQSILSEQAARFVSMDNSTRNAQETLITMHKQYNKLRQAKITKELTELSTSFQFNNRT